MRADMKDAAQRAVTALGLGNGPVHAEMRKLTAPVNVTRAVCESGSYHPSLKAKWKA